MGSKFSCNSAHTLNLHINQGDVIKATFSTTTNLVLSQVRRNILRAMGGETPMQRLDLSPYGSPESTFFDGNVVGHQVPNTLCCSRR